MSCLQRCAHLARRVQQRQRRPQPRLVLSPDLPGCALSSSSLSHSSHAVFSPASLAARPSPSSSDAAPAADRCPNPHAALRLENSASVASPPWQQPQPPSVAALPAAASAVSSASSLLPAPAFTSSFPRPLPAVYSSAAWRESGRHLAGPTLNSPYKRLAQVGGWVGVAACVLVALEGEETRQVAGSTSTHVLTPVQRVWKRWTAPFRQQPHSAEAAAPAPASAAASHSVIAGSASTERL